MCIPPMLDMPFKSSTGAQWRITNVGHAIQAEPLKHRRTDNQKVHDDDPVGKAALLGLSRVSKDFPKDVPDLFICSSRNLE